MFFFVDALYACAHTCGFQRIITQLCRCPLDNLVKRLKKDMQTLKTYIASKCYLYMLSSLWQQRQHSLVMKPPLALCLQNHRSNTVSTIWETYISFIKPASFCSFHWTCSFSLRSFTSKTFLEKSPGPKCPPVSFYTSLGKQATVAREMPHA